MLDPRRLGLAGGILWAVSLFVMTVVSMYTGYAHNFLEGLAQIYPGFSVSWPGSFIGLLYGFFDWFIGLYILAWLYNKLA